MTDVDAVPAERELPPYFAVSPFKFTAMCLGTLGLYEVWWFYKNWSRVRAREQSDIWPAWRAIFSIFWCYACCCRIRGTATSLGIPVKLPAGLLTVAWILHSLLVYLPDPWWMLSLFAFIWLLPAQAVANQINLTVVPDHNPNASFSRWNMVWIFIGVCLLALNIIAIFLPQPA
jgi:hypothetical protein